LGPRYIKAPTHFATVPYPGGTFLFLHHRYQPFLNRDGARPLLRNKHFPALNVALKSVATGQTPSPTACSPIRKLVNLICPDYNI
jgi:hypothetical protein